MNDRVKATFFIGNHQSVGGIGDWVRRVGSAFAAEGLDLSVASSIREPGFVVMLDEFSSRHQIDALLRSQIGSTSSTKYVLALSEFMDIDRSGNLRLNPFETWSAGMGWHRGRLDRTARSLWAAAARERYMHKRAAGLQYVLQHARIDLVLAGHPAIARALAGACGRWNVPSPPALDVLHPSMSMGVWEAQADIPRPVGARSPATHFIDDLTEGTRAGGVRQRGHLMPIVRQGHDTPYRQGLSRRISRLGIPYVGALEPLVLPQDAPYWGLDLVVPRSPDWPYLSPFRLLRAHSLGLIPVMLSSWVPEDDSPWESFVLRVESLDDLAALRLRLDTEHLHELTADKRAALAVDLMDAGAAWSEAMNRLGIRRLADPTP